MSQAGLLSSLLMFCCKAVFIYRIYWQKKWGVSFSYVSVFLMTVLAVSTYVFLPLAFDCKAAGGTTNRHLEAAQDIPGNLTTAAHASAPHLAVQYRCPTNLFNPMASLTQTDPEHVVSELWAEGAHFDVIPLAIFLVAYAFQFMLLPGMQH